MRVGQGRRIEEDTKVAAASGMSGVARAFIEGAVGQRVGQRVRQQAGRSRRRFGGRQQRLVLQAAVQDAVRQAGMLGQQQAQREPERVRQGSAGAARAVQCACPQSQRSGS